VGMSGLGHLLINLGCQVSASDRQEGPYLSKLAEAGAKTWTGSSPELIPLDAVIYYSSAVHQDDPERSYCTEKKIPVFPRHGLLKAISEQYYTIGISGTHGKTTTTGWVAYLFESAGILPNALVGGTITLWGSNFRKGDGCLSNKPLLIIEADESDESFLHINTKEAVITNIELDHVDNYQSIEQVQKKFVKFIENCDLNEGVFFPSFELETSPFEKMNAYKKIHDLKSKIEIDEKNHSVVFIEPGQKISFEVGLSGKHNLWNASAVLLLGLYHGFTPEILEKTLSEYTGVERRMQILKKYKNSQGVIIDIMDDYAHHPTEIKAVLETLIQKNENVIAIWEPHRVSRLLHFNEEFHKVFKNTTGFDNLFLMDIFDAAGEKNNTQYNTWKDIWKEWTSSTNGTIESVQNTRILIGKINQQNIKTTVVFLGAGNSSEYAKFFAGNC
jgi:UDP-N-acetylmuramate--alanine ligase